MSQPRRTTSFAPAPTYPWWMRVLRYLQWTRFNLVHVLGFTICTAILAEETDPLDRVLAAAAICFLCWLVNRLIRRVTGPVY